MKKPILYLLTGFLISYGLKSCSKASVDPRDKIYGAYRLKGNAHFTLFVGETPQEQDLPDSGSLFIDKVDDPDSSQWIRITGVLADANTDVFNFNPTGVSIVARYTDTLITIPSVIPISGFGSSIEGTAVFIKGSLTINYTAQYRMLVKNAVISSY